MGSSVCKENYYTKTICHVFVQTQNHWVKKDYFHGDVSGKLFAKGFIFHTINREDSHNLHCYFHSHESCFGYVKFDLFLGYSH